MRLRRGRMGLNPMDEARVQEVGWLTKLRVLFGVHYAEMLTYRAEIALWAVATMQPLIMMGVWAGAGESGRFDFNQVYVYRYFIVVFLIRQLTIVWTIHHFEFLIVTGRLSPMLLHPIDPSIRFIFMHLGEQWTRLPFALVIVGVFLYLYPQTLTGGGEAAAWSPGIWRIVLAIAVCYYAFILRFYMQYVLCMFAFWYERVAAMDAVIYLPYMFLSGLVFPFEALVKALPGSVMGVLLWTPFPYMVWFPASLVVGGGPPIMLGLKVMTGWLIVFYIISRWLWKKGLKHYSAMGA